VDIISSPPTPGELLSAALEYAARGWRVFPCHTLDPADRQCTCGDPNCTNPGKHPLTARGCLDATTDPEVVKQWWTEAPIGNVAIATGSESGIWVLDCDGQQGIEALAARGQRHETLPDTWTVHTGGGGRHQYFAWPIDATINIGNRTKLHKLPIDVRGANGYVLAPPSWHKSGNRYRLDSSPDVKIVPAPVWLVQWVSRHDAKVTETGQAPPPNPTTTLRVETGGSDIPSRIRGYLAKCPPAISGQRGHDATFAVACALVLGFGLSPDEAYPYLAEWNITCQPPWTEKELRHKLTDALKQPGERGYLLNAPIPTLPTVGSNRIIPEKKQAPVKLSSCRAEPEPYVPFPIEAVPEPARSFVRQGAEALVCDFAFLALPVLSILAAAIGNTRRVRLKRTWYEPAIIWTVVIGPSGSLKSPAFDLAMEPVHRIQHRKIEEYQQAVAGHLASELAYQRDLAAWKKTKGHLQPPQQPETPVCERIVAKDTTVERLAILLQENPRGLLLGRDELSGWFGSFNQYKQRGGADVANWLELHRAGTIIVDRKQGNQTLYIPRASASVTGGIQPETLARALTKEYFENGLAARLLLAMPKRLQKQWTEAELSSSTIQALTLLLETLFELKFNAYGEGASIPVDVSLDTPAKVLWVDFYNQWAKEQISLEGELAAAWSKLEGYAARLALVHHVVTHAFDRADHQTIGLEALSDG
jgi:hypothetical protein